MMLRGLKLPIFHHNDLTVDLRGVDVDYPLTSCDVRLMVFYHIEALSIFIDEEGDDREYCSIHTNDSEYICQLPLQVVQEKLEQHLIDCLLFLKT